MLLKCLFGIERLLKGIIYLLICFTMILLLRHGKDRKSNRSLLPVK